MISFDDFWILAEIYLEFFVLLGKTKTEMQRESSLPSEGKEGIFYDGKQVYN